MRVKDIMSGVPVCCAPSAPLEEAAQIMAEHDCGAIPVVDPAESDQLVGILTDRDIVVRTVAAGAKPAGTNVKDAMTSPAITVAPEATIEECCSLMEWHKVRRLPVERDGRICGIISQADVARHAAETTTGRLVKKLSGPGPAGRPQLGGSARMPTPPGYAPAPAAQKGRPRSAGVSGKKRPRES